MANVWVVKMTRSRQLLWRWRVLLCRRPDTTNEQNNRPHPVGSFAASSTLFFLLVLSRDLIGGTVSTTSRLFFFFSGFRVVDSFSVVEPFRMRSCADVDWTRLGRLPLLPLPQVYTESPSCVCVCVFRRLFFSQSNSTSTGQIKEAEKKTKEVEEVEKGWRRFFVFGHGEPRGTSWPNTYSIVSQRVVAILCIRQVGNRNGPSKSNGDGPPDGGKGTRNQ